MACALTLAIAWPVVFAPERLVYGHQIVGRQADLHAVISQLSEGAPSSPLAQPLTTAPGRLIAQVWSPVAALNVLILWTFPLTALATYALARYLHGSHTAALIAALVFSFSPAHLAQAAYHPFTAQTQWIPLYLLALVALVHQPSLARAAGLVLAMAVLVFANVEAALIAAFVSPVVVVAFWAIRPDADRNFNPLIWPLALLAAIAVIALAVAFLMQPAVLSRAFVAQFPIDEIGFYRARWWAYFVPAVDHPVLGATAQKIFGERGISLELVEQQLFLGYAFLALALAALGVSAWTWRPQWRYVTAIVVIGLAAALLSVGPVSGSCEPFSLAPACLAFRIAPVFRIYARVGIVVHLAVAIAAGAGAAILLKHSRGWRIVATALLALGVFEFWPWPARAHDVLPTAGHRWLTMQTDTSPAFDCYPANQADRFVAWLMKRQVSFLTPAVPTCADPELGKKLAALGYGHIIVRGGAAASKLLSPLPPGIALAQDLPDSRVYAVETTPPAVVTVSTSGFYGYEHQDDDWWRWMSPTGTWTVRNTTAGPQRVTLEVDLVPIGIPRTVALTLDGAPVATLALAMDRKQFTLGPWTLTPGDHVLTFAADGEPIRPADVADSRDARPLTVAFRNDRWLEAR